MLDHGVLDGAPDLFEIKHAGRVLCGVVEDRGEISPRRVQHLIQVIGTVFEIDPVRNEPNWLRGMFCWAGKLGVRRPDRFCGWSSTRAYPQRANRATYTLSLGHEVPPWA
jgi:hypothetical protein